MIIILKDGFILSRERRGLGVGGVGGEKWKVRTKTVQCKVMKCLERVHQFDVSCQRSIKLQLLMLLHCEYYISLLSTFWWSKVKIMVTDSDCVYMNGTDRLKDDLRWPKVKDQGHCDLMYLCMLYIGSLWPHNMFYPQFINPYTNEIVTIFAAKGVIYDQFTVKASPQFPGERTCGCCH